jgi:hypothetical protein
MRADVPFSLEPGDWMTVFSGEYAGRDGEVLEVQEVPPLVVRARLRVGFEENYWQAVWKEPMTEAEWLTTHDSAAMERFLFALEPPPSQRKWRLFACACARQALPGVPTRLWRKPIEWIEAYADNPVTLRASFDRFRADLAQQLGTGIYVYETHVNHLIAQLLISGDLLPEWPREIRGLAAQIATPCSSAHSQRQFLRDVMGNPFHTVRIEPIWLAWQNGEITRLAESIYDEHRWEEMSILGDALEDAGCTDEAMLSHCRTPGLHARGCWLLDGLLGKT